MSSHYPIHPIRANRIDSDTTSLTPPPPPYQSPYTNIQQTNNRVTLYNTNLKSTSPCKNTNFLHAGTAPSCRNVSSVKDSTCPLTPTPTPTLTLAPLPPIPSSLSSPYHHSSSIIGGTRMGLSQTNVKHRNQSKHKHPHQLEKQHQQPTPHIHQHTHTHTHSHHSSCQCRTPMTHRSPMLPMISNAESSQHLSGASDAFIPLQVNLPLQCLINSLSQEANRPINHNHDHDKKMMKVIDQPNGNRSLPNVKQFRLHKRADMRDSSYHRSRLEPNEGLIPDDDELYDQSLSPTEVGQTFSLKTNSKRKRKCVNNPHKAIEHDHADWKGPTKKKPRKLPLTNMSHTLNQPMHSDNEDNFLESPPPSTEESFTNNIAAPFSALSQPKQTTLKELKSSVQNRDAPSRTALPYTSILNDIDGRHVIGSSYHTKLETNYDKNETQSLSVTSRCSAISIVSRRSSVSSSSTNSISIDRMQSDNPLYRLVTSNHLQTEGELSQQSTRPMSKTLNNEHDSNVDTLIPSLTKSKPLTHVEETEAVLLNSDDHHSISTTSISTCMMVDTDDCIVIDASTTDDTRGPSISGLNSDISLQPAVVKECNGQNDDNNNEHGVEHLNGNDDGDDDSDSSSSSQPNIGRSAPASSEARDQILSNQYLPEGCSSQIKSDPIRSTIDLTHDPIDWQEEYQARQVEVPLKFQSPSSYIHLSAMNLSQSTIESLHKCGSVKITCHKIPKVNHRKVPPWTPHVIDHFIKKGFPTSKLVTPFYHQIDSGEDRCQIIAKKEIPTETVIGFMGGDLIEIGDHESHAEPHHSNCLAIPSSFLRPSGYDGSDLILCFHGIRNFGSVIRPPIDATENPDKDELKQLKQDWNTAQSSSKLPPQLNRTQNLKLEAYIDKNYSTVWILIVAATKILPHQELFLTRSVGTFTTEQHFALTRGGRACHYVHERIRRMETEMVRNVLREEGKSMHELKKMTLTEQGMKIENLVPQFQCPDSEIAPLKSTLHFDHPLDLTPHAPLMREIDPLDAFSISQTMLIQTSFIGTRDSKQRRDLQQQLNRLPEQLPKQTTIGNAKVTFQPNNIKYILEHGHDPELLELFADESLHSTVRLFTIPSQTSLGVRVKKNSIAHKGIFVYAYCGRVDLFDNVDQHSEYLYPVESEEISQQLNRYDLPRLGIDGKMFGGIGRYVNDDHYRGRQRSKANVESMWMAYKGMIHLAFYAIRDIKGGEELITSYGDAYWQRTNENICLYQSQYLNVALLYSSKLEDIFQRNQWEIPCDPPEEIERLNRFHEKPVPYPIRMLEDYAPAKICRAPDSEDEAFHADLDAIALKQIVSRRFTPRGEKEYLVEHIDSNLRPRWYKREELSEELTLIVGKFDSEYEQEQVCLLERNSAASSEIPSMDYEFRIKKDFISEKPYVITVDDPVLEPSPPPTDQDSDYEPISASTSTSTSPSSNLSNEEEEYEDDSSRASHGSVKKIPIDDSNHLGRTSNKRHRSRRQKNKKKKKKKSKKSKKDKDNDECHQGSTQPLIHCKRKGKRQSKRESKRNNRHYKE